jgi:hypothetical protein
MIVPLLPCTYGDAVVVPTIVGRLISNRDEEAT